MAPIPNCTSYRTVVAPNAESTLSWYELHILNNPRRRITASASEVCTARRRGFEQLTLRLSALIIGRSKSQFVQYALWNTHSVYLCVWLHPKGPAYLTDTFPACLTACGCATTRYPQVLARPPTVRNTDGSIPDDAVCSLCVTHSQSPSLISTAKLRFDTFLVSHLTTLYHIQMLRRVERDFR
jgi:hypothetical protein